MKRLILLCTVFVFLVSCTRKVTRVDPGESYDLSGRWNDTDSRAVAENMTTELLNSDKFKEYAGQEKGKPAIVVGDILNKTSEHIDADNFVKKIEVTIFNSGIADLVESESFRDKIRQERAQQQDFASSETAAEWGKEIGADLMLFGEMTSETDVFNNKRVVNYIITMFLTDIETNRRVWYGQKEIKKFIKN